MSYSNHNGNNYQIQRDDELSIDVGPGPLGFTSDIDMHNRCCSGRFWCIQDICGIICAVLTWFLILYAMFVTFSVILIPSFSTHTLFSVFNLFLFFALSILAFSSHIRTMLTDPVSLYISLYFELKHNFKPIIMAVIGCRTKGQCNQRNDSKNGTAARPSDI